MPGSDLDLLIEAAREAGEIALHHKAKGLEIKEKPGDEGPVTQADIAVDRALKDRLTDARPGYAWLSEETEDDLNRLTQKTIFVIDPIDGTRSFINGEQTWAHSIAIVEDGVATHGVVYLPEMDLLYTASASQGAELNGEKLNVSNALDIDAARILTTKPNVDPKHWTGPVPGFKRSHRPSLAYRLSLVAQGRYDAMMTFRPSWEWDIAAGAVILSEAGATVTDRHGKPLVFNNKTPKTAGVVGAGPALHQQISERLVYTG